MKIVLLMTAVVLVAFNAFGEDKQEALCDAVKSGEIAEVRQMANTGKNLDARDSQNWTPLMVAAQAANAEAVKLLVEAGADINATDKGFTVIDQLESILRRINLNTPEYKQKHIEQMRRDGIKEDVIKRIIQMDEASIPRQNSTDAVRKWQAILDYLKQVKESKGKKDAGQEKPSAGSSSNRVEGTTH